MKENIEVRTDTEPIYNHFPDLPATQDIQWCSRTSDGIGLTTVELNIFAIYDHDIRSELRDMEIEKQGGDIDLYFVPDGIEAVQGWRRLENADFAFQSGIRETRKMCTTAYINDAGTILYIEAIGE